MKLIVLLMLVLVACEKSNDTTNPKPTPVVESTPVADPTPVDSSFLKVGSKFLIHTNDDCDDVKDDYSIIFFDPGVDKKCTEKFKAKGIIVGGYMSAGSAEKWRDDYDALSCCKLSKMKGWNEYWLDVKRPEVLEVMKKRIDYLHANGFQALYLDNFGVYEQESRVSIDDCKKYGEELAKYAHSKGMLIGPNNGLELISKMVGTWDFYVGEECIQYNECYKFNPIAGKYPIFHLEYKEKYCKPISGHSVALVNGLSQGEFIKWCK